MIELPTYEYINNKYINKIRMTALEAFIFDNEPAGKAEEIMFREQLLCALNEVVEEEIEKHMSLVSPDNV